MQENPTLAQPRSPLLMNRENTALVVIDVQKKLTPSIQNAPFICWNISRLIRGCHTLSVPVIASEQYPAGLGETLPFLATLMADAGADVREKTMFSCREVAPAFNKLLAKGVQNLVITGLESHVCVLQSALDLIGQGFNVFAVVDAVGSRFQIDHETALCRLELSGVTLVSTEMVLFELCETAAASDFKSISRLVREELPAELETH